MNYLVLSYLFLIPQNKRDIIGNLCDKNKAKRMSGEKHRKIKDAKTENVS